MIILKCIKELPENCVGSVYWPWIKFRFKAGCVYDIMVDVDHLRSYGYPSGEGMIFINNVYFYDQL